MAAMPSEDNFDTLPDDFEGIDWDTVPELSPLSQANTSSSQSRTDNSSPHVLVGIDSENLGSRNLSISTSFPGFSAPSATVPFSPFGTSSVQSSTEYSFDDVDDSFLEEVCAIETRLTQAPTDNQFSGYRCGCVSGPSNIAASSSFPLLSQPPSTAESHNTSLTSVPNLSPGPTPRGKRSQDLSQLSPTPHKKARSDNVSSTSPRKIRTPKGKGKKKEGRDPAQDVKQVLEGFEDELTCPICCDIFACAHLGNPCGHSFCGECGWGWICKNKRAPTCAICRAKLSPAAPMILNFAMDNTIERHVHALAMAGVDEWKEGGLKYREWIERKEKWKAGTTKRAEEIKGASAAPGGQAVIDLTGVADNPNAVDYTSSEESSTTSDNHDSPEESDHEAPRILPPLVFGAPHPLPLPPPVHVAVNHNSGRGRGGRGGPGGEGGGRGRGGRRRRNYYNGRGGGGAGGGGSGSGGWRGRGYSRGRGGRGARGG